MDEIQTKSLAWKAQVPLGFDSNDLGQRNFGRMRVGNNRWPRRNRVGSLNVLCRRVATRPWWISGNDHDGTNLTPWVWYIVAWRHDRGWSVGKTQFEQARLFERYISTRGDKNVKGKWERPKWIVFGRMHNYQISSNQLISNRSKSANIK